MLRVNICGIGFKNPLIAASGTFGFGSEYSQFYNISELGGICTKGLTLKEKEGNEGVRVWEIRSGMMNSIGLQNPGIDKFILSELPKMKKLNTNIIANLGGDSIEEYINGIIKLNNSDIDMVELNISCPNVKRGGMAFGIKSAVAYEVVEKVKEVCTKPMIVKLSPNAEDIVTMAVKCSEAGADAISLVNTFKSLAVDVYKRKPIFKNVYAGLSGPAIKPIALRMVHEVCKNVDVPVIGIGGILTAEDALEYIMVGAAAVQVGTANFVKPTICMDIKKGIKDFMNEQGIKNLSEIRGII